MKLQTQTFRKITHFESTPIELYHLLIRTCTWTGNSGHGRPGRRSRIGQSTFVYRRQCGRFRPVQNGTPPSPPILREWSPPQCALLLLQQREGVRQFNVADYAPPSGRREDGDAARRLCRRAGDCVDWLGGVAVGGGDDLVGAVLVAATVVAQIAFEKKVEVEVQ